MRSEDLGDGRHYRALFPPSFVPGRTERWKEKRAWSDGSWCRGGWGG